MSEMEKKRLSDDVLYNVSGGKDDTQVIDEKQSNCPICNKERMFKLYSGGRAICKKCGYEKFM